MATFSMNVISKTLNDQVEMIAPGVMGINFMKPEKPINTTSDVYRLVQEEEQKKVKSPTPSGGATPFFKQTKIPPYVAPRPAPKAPVPSFSPAPAFTPAPKPVPVLPSAPAMPAPMVAPAAMDTPSQGPCTDCGRTIIGPFVSLSDRILHDDCFKCSTCGASLRNVGFHSINHKLYCELHAAMAARVVSSAAVPTTDTTTPDAPAPLVEPIVPAPAALQSPLPKLPVSIGQPTPTPFGQQRLPQTPSSSGGLTFRSISPQPFKRISGDFHSVVAPSSPTPGATPSTSLAYASGPLPFESKPYMPPDQVKSSLFTSLSDFTQSTEISQSVQRTTQVTQQVTSHCQQSIDYKQYSSGQTRKFIWPPTRPELEGEVDDSASAPAPLQKVSSLVLQSTPSAADIDSSVSLQSIQQIQQQQVIQEKSVKQEITELAEFNIPPLPTTFAEPDQSVNIAKAAEPKIELAHAAPAMVPPQSGQGPSNFSPSLAPVAETRPTATPAQSGVPTGAGSRTPPRKGRGQLMQEHSPGRLAVCGDCGDPIRGPFIIALNRTWCPDHFHCNNAHCKAHLIDIGFVEEQGQLYCEHCYEAFLAPICSKCAVRIKGDCLNALDKQWHPECFICAYCSKPFGNTSFYLEDGLPYCEKDWNELFTTKCVGCGFPIEAGDRWVEALNNNYHSQCFKCSSCQKNLEGQSFYAKGGKPYCKQHAR